MFTRSLFQTADMSVQGQLLATVAQLVDAGRIRSTQRQHLGRITAENLRQAHVLQESGTSIGKTGANRGFKGGLPGYSYSAALAFHHGPCALGLNSANTCSRSSSAKQRCSTA